MKVDDLLSLVQKELGLSVFIKEDEDGEILVYTRHKLDGDDLVELEPTEGPKIP